MSLLGLAMIVKDEARGIVRTLESVRPILDRWTIVDTGSTDGTQDLIRGTMDGIPGELLEAPFVDFATTRNAALSALGTSVEFSLMLSGDERLEAASQLRRFCEEHEHESDGAYDIRVEFGSTIYRAPRLARTSAHWRYVGRTHEVLVAPDGSVPSRCVELAFIYHDGSGRTPLGQISRWERDKVLLEEDLNENPTNTRAMFYLAQTYECLGDYWNACKLYQRRNGCGGFMEERFEATFRLARCMEKLGRKWKDVEETYLHAYSMMPHRAEPLLAIAEHWHAEGRWPLAHLYGSAAAALRYPTDDRLFVDRDAYEWRSARIASEAAMRLGHHVEAKLLFQRVAAARPRDPFVISHAEAFGVALP